MSDKTAAPAKEGDLTARETEILAAAWQCMKTDPEIDIPKLAALLDFKNPRSVSNAMSVIKRKLAAMVDAARNPDAAAADGSVPASPATGGRGKTKGAAAKKAPAARKRGKPAAADANDESAAANGEDADADLPSPPKKARASRAKPKVSKAAAPKVEVEDEGAMGKEAADEESKRIKDEAEAQANAIGADEA